LMKCAIRLLLRHLTAWAKLARRRLVTSVMVMLFIKHRVHWVIMMMVMRRIQITIKLWPFELDVMDPPFARIELPSYLSSRCR
jgi:hypothetical protein